MHNDHDRCVGMSQVVKCDHDIMDARMSGKVECRKKHGTDACRGAVSRLLRVRLGLGLVESTLN